MCLLLIVDVLLQSACRIEESKSGPYPRGGEGDLLDLELLFNVFLFLPY